ncbi:MAG: GntR family transcriptional regulator [Tissierellia bacterium]|nr:GntR family transcriptional regulator [Tissierellia bacterium]
MLELLKQDEIFEELKNRIVRLDYEPGKILNEVEISEEFGVSRTPIRHAFQRLELHKLIQIVPRYGAQVPQIDFIRMKSLFELTMVLDPFAARLATDIINQDVIDELDELVERLKNYDMAVEYREAILDDEKFHEIILENCGNEWLQEILTGLHFHSERLWHYCNRFFESPEIFHDTLEPVVEAIKKRDADSAEKYARIHIEQFVGRIKSTLL